MKKQIQWIAIPILFSCLILVGCKTRQAAVVAPPPPGDTIVLDYFDLWDLEEPVVQYASPKKFDLIHTRLDLGFDWSGRTVQGTAFLRMKPWFHPSSEVVLDAKAFVIGSVERKTETGWESLQHDYDNRRLKVKLDKSYSRDQEFELRIRYTAQPYKLDSILPEEAEEQGLYFVNHDGSIPGLPMQIWTQGESHGASAWFPTFDQPNIRCTQEMFLTVQDSFITLSNGLLTGSVKQPGGLRTDHWEMKQPHAPYLFMLAVGRFSKVSDTWRGKEVSYYVEPEYERVARLIFGNTPEMLEFFSNRLGVPYPWDKYAQIVVRQFVSGAMENTTATIHYEQVQHDARAHLDNTQEDLVSHELFHHWFGDLVTCKNWANLTLNEGFASYGEYLWKDYKYGQDQADLHILNDRKSYFSEASIKREPLIRHMHADPSDMFDGHSYQKGACVIHMLRGYLGDAVFFESLKRYLTQHAYTDVEVDELRMAFESVSGEDLKWFFDQWFLRSGHPMLEVVHQPQSDGSWKVGVKQLQPEYQGEQVFRFPVTFGVYSDKGAEAVELWVETADTVFEFGDGANHVHNVVFDKNHLLLAEILLEEKPVSGWLSQLGVGLGSSQVLLAAEQLSNHMTTDSVLESVAGLRAHPCAEIREKSISLAVGHALKTSMPGLAPDWLKAFRDPSPLVRSTAIDAMQMFAPANELTVSGGMGDSILQGLKYACLDSSYRVQASALLTLAAFSTDEAVAVAKSLMSTANSYNMGLLVTLMGVKEPDSALVLAERILFRDFSGRYETKWTVMEMLSEWIAGGVRVQAASRVMMDYLRSSDETILRVACFRDLISVRQYVPELREFLEAASKAEKDPDLQAEMIAVLSESW